MRVRTLIAFAPLLLLTTLICVGCTPSGSTIDSADPIPVDLPVHTLSLDQIRDLSMSTQSKSEMAAGFPVPLPVIDGMVVEARLLPVEGAGEWIYIIELSSAPETVFEWYSRAYPIANWQIDSAEQVTEGGEVATTLEMTKGSAHSRITIRPDGSGARVEAEISIGGEGAVAL